VIQFGVEFGSKVVRVTTLNLRQMPDTVTGVIASFAAVVASAVAKRNPSE